MTREDLPTKTNEPTTAEGYEFSYRYILNAIENGYVKIMKRKYMDIRTRIERQVDFYISKGDVYCAFVEISKTYNINFKKYDDEYYAGFSIQINDKPSTYNKVSLHNKTFLK